MTLKAPIERNSYQTKEITHDLQNVKNACGLCVQTQTLLTPPPQPPTTS